MEEVGDMKCLVMNTSSWWRDGDESQTQSKLGSKEDERFEFLVEK